MIILGLNAYHPDSAAAIIMDGKLIAACEEERFNRIKHWAGFPAQSISYCLETADVSLQDVDYITLNRNPAENLAKKIAFFLFNRLDAGFIKSRAQNAFLVKNIKRIIAGELKIKKSSIKAKVYHIEHHNAHLSSSFLISPFKEAALVSVDGFGDFNSCKVGVGAGNKMRVLYSVNYPHSLGIFYTALTQYLGFRKFGDEYKVMGLSAYGRPKYLREMEELLMLRPDGKFALNLKYFSFYNKGDKMQWDNCEPSFSNLYSAKLPQKFAAPRKPEDEISEYHCDIAASMQAMYERALFHVLNHAYKITGLPMLALSGGCALNSLANGKIFDATPFKDIYISPSPHDAGGAIGSAYYLYNQVLGKERSFVMNSAYWGPEFSEEYISGVVKSKNAVLQERSCRVEKMPGQESLCKLIAEEISKGKIIGWFQGRMEWGPRALGNRSILVDPRIEGMKEVLNSRIKRREWFRPFAPSILVEKTGEYFEKDYPDPFMLKVYKVREEKRKIIPAVTHIDGTGRLQTVAQKDNPLYYKLIKEFEYLTGVPVLLNTSFNENEPIVRTPEEAMECFLRTKMDILAIGTLVVIKEKL